MSCFFMLPWETKPSMTTPTPFTLKWASTGTAPFLAASCVFWWAVCFTDISSIFSRSPTILPQLPRSVRELPLDERGYLVGVIIILEDEIFRGLPGTLEHQPAFTEGCIDFVNDKDDAVRKWIRRKKREDSFPG